MNSDVIISNPEQEEGVQPDGLNNSTDRHGHSSSMEVKMESHSGRLPLLPLQYK